MEIYASAKALDRAVLNKIGADRAEVVEDVHNIFCLVLLTRSQ